jgi:hypothetical protein
MLLNLIEKEHKDYGESYKMRSFQTCIIYQNIVTNAVVNICGMYGGNEKLITK